MRAPVVFRTPAEVNGDFGPCAVAIGNFDGVHLGHQTLLREASAFAAGRGITAAALTFDPHPTAVVAPERCPKLICTLEERIALLGRFGARHVFVLPFTAAVAATDPVSFVEQLLLGDMQAQGVFVGESFRFGCRQQGDARLLRSLADEHNFVARCLPPVTLRNEIVSSSAIRRYVAQGNVTRANRLLDRCFSIRGTVVSGQGIGSKQTVPTLNLRPDPALLLPKGVFVTQTRQESTGREWNSITNVGMRPTFGGQELTIETFLLSPIDGHAPEQIEVSFRRFLRAERQFASAAELKAQIMTDVGRAQTYWRRIARLPTLSPSIY